MLKKFACILLLIMLVSCGVAKPHIYLPIVEDSRVLRGVELTGPGQATSLATQLQQATPDFVRLFVKWAEVEPMRGTYIWNAQLDKDVSLLAGRHILMVIKAIPSWARADARLCSRPLSTALPDFAKFAAAVARRYTTVWVWEIGNEEDSASSTGDYYGCWGAPTEPYYGGGYYAEILHQVSPAIKGAAPNALVAFGGLMLPCTDCTQATFLEGALLAGAGTYIDMVDFHWYEYFGTKNPHTFPQVVAFLRSKTNKTLLLSETSYLCLAGAACPSVDGDQPSHIFYKEQASYLESISIWVKQLNIYGFIWYSLPSNGWNNSGLLWPNGTYKPVFCTWTGDC